MEHNKIEFYKLFLDELHRKKAKGSIDAKAFEAKLFGLLNKELDNTQRLNKIEDHVARVAYKFDVIDKESEKRAQHFYKDFPEANDTLKELKVALIKNYQLFDLSHKKEDHKQAAKYAILQLEGVLNYLELTLIKLIEENTQKNTKIDDRGTNYVVYTYKRTNKVGKVFSFDFSISYSKKRGKYLSLKHKYMSAQYFLPVSFSISQNNMIDTLIDVRNLDSHQFLSDEAKESENKLQSLSSSPNEYYNAVFDLIRSCFSKLS